jgi:hypothetical protein
MSVVEKEAQAVASTVEDISNPIGLTTFCPKRHNVLSREAQQSFMSYEGMLLRFSYSIA